MRPAPGRGGSRGRARGLCWKADPVGRVGHSRREARSAPRGWGQGCSPEGSDVPPTWRRSPCGCVCTGGPGQGLFLWAQGFGRRMDLPV